MKEFKGTPGSWLVDGLDVETNDFYVCNVGDYTLDERFEIEVGKIISEANANLIAAAPELLSAVNLILELQLRGFITLGDKNTATLESAIAKALGESK